MSQKTESKTSNTALSQTQGGSVAKNALKMTLGTMTSRVLGLFREVLLAALFEKHVTDSWMAAFRVPNLFRRLLGEGSLSVSFIPVFVQTRMADAEADFIDDSDQFHRSRNMVNATYTVLLLILSVILAMGLFFPEWILSTILDPAYIAQTDKYLLTVRFARIMFFFVFFITNFAFYMGILNALGEFFWPAVAPTLFNVVLVISTVFPKAWIDGLGLASGDQLAWGVVIGGALQAGILIPFLIKKGYWPKMTFRIKNSDMLKVFRNMVPGLIGMGLLQFTTLLNLRFSSSLEEGTISYINYIDRLIELPLSLISVSLGTALLPSLSALWSTGQKDKMAEQSRQFLEINLLISLLGACVLFVLAEPIVQTLFGRGHFSNQDVLISSQILKTYCWVLLFVSGVRVLTPAYFAVQNTWFPALISGVCLAVHFFLAPYLMSFYQVHGLMMSTIFTAFLNLFMLMFFYQKLVTRFEYKKFFRNISKFILIGISVVGLSYIYFIFPKAWTDYFVGRLVILLFTFAITLVGFLFMCRILNVNDIQLVLHKLKNKLVKRSK